MILVIELGFSAIIARWVTDTLEIERSTAYRQLEELHEDGEVEREKLSLQVGIW